MRGTWMFGLQAVMLGGISCLKLAALIVKHQRSKVAKSEATNAR